MKKLMQLPSSLVQDVPYNLVSDEMPVAPYLAPIVSLFTQSHTAVFIFFGELRLWVHQVVQCGGSLPVDMTPQIYPTLSRLSRAEYASH
jgi:hypothetical protein